MTAVPASATTRDRAADDALAALGSAHAGTPVVVLGLAGPLRPGTAVTRPGSAKRVLRVGHEPAFFFYEDRAPLQPNHYRGRVALVGARSGKVRLSKTIRRSPLIRGKLPVFLRSAESYSSPRYRVFSNLAGAAIAPASQQVDASVFSTTPITAVTTFATSDPAHPNSPPKADGQFTRAKMGKPKHILLTGADDDGDSITFAITNPPSHGTLTGAPPEVTYTPNAGYLGRDAFSFKTYDDAAQSNTGRVHINVVPLGSPPVATASSGCTAYSEQTGAVVVDGALTVSDPDDTVLDSATVRITNLEGGDDLLFTDQNGITGAYDDDLGVLTLTGTATVAQYEAALRTVRYRNLSSGSPSLTRDIAFTVNDAGSDSAPATKQVCITDTGGNRRPVTGTSEGALNYTENDGPAPIDAGLFVTDNDSATLSGATVKFAASESGEEEEIPGGGPGSSASTFVPDEDALAFTDQNGITGSYDDVLGVLTLTGTASVADYQAALQSVTYENSSENPSEAPRSLRFQVTDSTGFLSVPTSRTVLITRVNDAPVVTPSDGAGSYTEGDPATAIDSGLTVGDVDDTEIEGGEVKIASGFEAGDELVFSDQSGITGSYDSGTGVLTLTGTALTADYETALRSIQFQQTGNDDPQPLKQIEYTVSDGELGAAPATRDLAVTGVNDKPVLDTSDTRLAVTEGDAPAAIDPGLTASDVDSATFQGATVQIGDGFSISEDRLAYVDQLGITGVYDDEIGVLTLSGSAPIADYETALRSVTYENRSDGPTSPRTVTFTVDDGGATDNLSDPATRDIDITGVNDAPEVTASDGSASYTAGDPAGVIDADLTVFDADDFDIEGAQVRIASGFEPGDDLAFADQSGITGAYDSDTGVLTLTGTAPLADYETALRSVAFGHTGADPVGPKTVEFTVNDGDLDSDAASKTIDIVIPPPPE